MRVALAASVFLLGSLQLPGQAPAGAAAPVPAPVPEQSATPAQSATQPPQVENTDVGFTYSLPSDWEIVASPTAHAVTVPYPELIAKKGDACVEVIFTAKHGTPASVVVVMALPFACYGQTLKPGDLANFGAGAAEGLKQTFDVTDPVQGNYTLGSHAVWIERANGTPKGHTGDSFIFETACTVLTKGAVCWVTMAADKDSLHAFQRAPVTLDGEIFPELVPGHSFVQDSQ
jgi:hypothetical protein